MMKTEDAMHEECDLRMELRYSSRRWTASRARTGMGAEPRNHDRCASQLRGGEKGRGHKKEGDPHYAGGSCGGRCRVGSSEGDPGVGTRVLSLPLHPTPAASSGEAWRPGTARPLGENYQRHALKYVLKHYLVVVCY